GALPGGVEGVVLRARCRRGRRAGGAGNVPRPRRRGAAHLPARRPRAARGPDGRTRRGAVRSRGAARSSALAPAAPAGWRGDRPGLGAGPYRLSQGHSRRGAGMGRLRLAVLVLTLGGCEPLRQAFSARATVVASAAGQELTVQQFADWVGHSAKVPLQPSALTGLANVYVDHMLFAAAVAQGRDLHDSLLVLAAGWPAVSQLKWDHFHQRLLVARTKLSPTQVDSPYAAGGVPLFQHLLLQLPPSAALPQERTKRTQLDRLRRDIAARGGASFAQFARRYSEDP